MNIEFFLNRLDEFLIQNNYCDFKEINISKGQEVFLTDFHLIVKGKMEIFIMTENGEYTKIFNFTEKDGFFGGFTHLWKSSNQNNFSYDQNNFFYDQNYFTVFFRAKSDIVLKKIPFNIMVRALKDFNINKFFIEITFKRMTAIISHFFSRNYNNRDELVKFLLESESDTSNIVEIDNVYDFVEKYNISRSTFYKGIRKLEKNKQIKKIKNKIIIVK